MKSILRGVAVAAILLAACGVKKSPRPPLSSGPPSVADLTVFPREGNLLTWTTPQPEANSKQTVPEQFVVIRRQWSPEEKAWLEPETMATVPAPEEGGEIQWLDENVEAGAKYTYSVMTVDSKGRTGEFGAPVVTQWAPPPGMPLNLSAEPGDHTVILKWEAPDGDVEVEGYYIYRAGDTGNTGDEGEFRRISEDAVPRPTFFDAALENGKTYRYKIRAASLAGTNLVEGPPSESVSVVPADLISPQVPVGVGAFPTEGGVTVRWWPNGEDDLAGYHVYRRYGRETIRLTEKPVTEAEFLDTTAKDRKVYRYSVTAIDYAGNVSPPSERARVYVKR